MGEGAEGVGRLGEVVQATLASGCEDLVPLVQVVLEYGLEGEAVGALRAAAGEATEAIEGLCQRHYGQFVRSVSELAEVEARAEALEAEAERHNSRIQEAGQPLRSLLEELRETYQTLTGVREAKEVASFYAQALRLCLEAEGQVGGSDLYGALTTLATVEQTLARPGGESGDALDAINVFVRDQIGRVRGGLERSLSSAFNAWLVDARQTESQVGTAAVELTQDHRTQQLAAYERQRQVLSGIRQAWAEGSGLETLLAGQSGVGGGGGLSLLEVGGDRGSPLGDFDFTPLHRCQHLHQRLGQAAGFYLHYDEQRQLQLNSDLEQFKPSKGDFRGQYVALFTKIVGFFAIECQVGATAEGLAPPERIARLWSTASEFLATRLQDWVAGGPSMGELQAVSFDVALRCDAVRQYVRDISVLEDLLRHVCLKKMKYLLVEKVQKDIESLCESDAESGFTPVTVADVQTWEDEVFKVGLVAPGTSSPPKSFPCVVLVTDPARRVCQCLHDAVDIASEFLVGLSCRLSSFYGLLGDSSGSTEQLDDIKECLFGSALANAVDHLIREHSNSMSQATQILANVCSMAYASTHLDAYVSDFNLQGKGPLVRTQGLGAPQGAGEPSLPSTSGAGGREGMRAIGAVYDGAEESLVRIVAAKLNSFIVQVSLMEWRPKSPPERTCDEDGAVANSDYIDDALVFLEVTFATLTESLQPGACLSVMRRIMDECAACILKSFEGAIPSFNMFAIMQVDAEFRALEAFVAKWPGLVPGPVSSELRQILDFLLSGNPESILDTEARMSLYPDVEMERLLRILDKYRDTPRTEAPNLGAGVSEWPKRSTMDKIMKKVREPPPPNSRLGFVDKSRAGFTS